MGQFCSVMTHVKTVSRHKMLLFCVADIDLVHWAERQRHSLKTLNFRSSKHTSGTKGEAIFSPIPHSCKLIANSVILVEPEN